MNKRSPLNARTLLPALGVALLAAGLPLASPGDSTLPASEPRSHMVAEAPAPHIGLGFALLADANVIGLVALPVGGAIGGALAGAEIGAKVGVLGGPATGVVGGLIGAA